MRAEFELLKEDGRARRGRLQLRHGPVETPVFMPVGTQGTVKALGPDDLAVLGPQIILANTYHLYLRPGAEALRRAGKLHRFMAWPKNILTDSGGFQVFSLGAGSAEKEPLLEKITEEGAHFRSHLDGSRHLLTPEKSIAVQEAIGSDIMMAFDECPPPSKPREYQIASLERTTRWAQRCLDARTDEGGALFGIVQGGLDLELRARHARELSAMPFEGLAIGGLAVGESKEDFLKTLQFTAGELPRERPRYLMGVGTPEDLVAGVAAGIDMFDCVMPTRNARNGTLFVSSGKLQIKNAAFANDDSPVEAGCPCYTCRTFSRAYLRHLFVAEELLFFRLATLHNLTHYLELMRRVREAIEAGAFAEFQRAFAAQRRPAPSSQNPA